MKPDVLKGHLDLLLLAVVDREPAHGYALIEALKQRSGGAFELPEGTVYPALHRLERAGLLASTWTSHLGRGRRIYHLTPRGREALRAREREWARFAAGVGAVLGETDGPSDRLL